MTREPTINLSENNIQREGPALQLPPFKIPVRDGDRASQRLRQIVALFFNSVANTHRATQYLNARIRELESGAIDELSQAETGGSASKRIVARIRLRAKRDVRQHFPKFNQTPRMQIAAAAGLGKTSAVIKEYRDRPEFWGMSIDIYEPTIELCHEVAGKINSDPPSGMPLAVVMAGRTHRQPNGTSPCARSDIVQIAQGRIRSVYRSFCDTGDGDRCTHYDVCHYIRLRRDTSPRIRLYPHASLTIPQPGELEPPKPALVIVDESAIGAYFKSTSVTPDAFGLVTTYLSDHCCEREAHEHAKLGKAVAERITTYGANFLRHLVEISETSEIQNRLLHAARAADKCKQFAQIVPSDTDDEVELKLNRVLPSQCSSVAAVLKRIRTDLRNGRSVCQPIVYIPGEGGRKGRPPQIRCVGLRKSRFANNTPLLLLDADAVHEINKRIFCRDVKFGLRSVVISARRLGKFTQCNDQTFSTTALAELASGGESPDQPRTVGAEKRRNKIVQMAQQRAATGQRVLLSMSKPVRKAISCEDDPLPVSFQLSKDVEIAHYGNLTGQDRWKTFDALFIVGRDEPPASALEEVARAICADDTQTIITQIGAYVRALRPYGPNCAPSAVINAHPDPIVQQLLELRRERQVAQAIDRLRLIYPDHRDPEIVILGKMPIPGIVPVLKTTDEIYGNRNRLEQAYEQGVFSTHSRFLTKLYPDLWHTEKAASRWLENHRSELPDPHKDIYAEWGVLKRVEFRIAGAKRWSRAWIDLSRFSEPSLVISGALQCSVQKRLGSPDETISAPSQFPASNQPKSARPVLVFVRAKDFTALCRSAKCTSKLAA